MSLLQRTSPLSAIPAAAVSLFLHALRNAATTVRSDANA